MDPLKHSPLPVQDSSAVSTTPKSIEASAGLLEAVDVDEFALLALFDTDTSLAGEYSVKTTEDKAATIKEEKGTAFEKKGTEVKDKGTATKQKGTIVEEQAVQKNESSIQQEKAGKTQKTVAMAERMQAADAVDSIFAVTYHDGKVELKQASSLDQDHLEQAHTDGAVAFRHGNELGISPEFALAHGLQNGQKVAWVDEHGVTHELNIRHFTSEEMNLLSNVVNDCITQIADNIKEKDPEDHKHKKEVETHLNHNHVAVIVIKDKGRAKDERVQSQNADSLLETIKKDDLKLIEQTKEEAAREQEHKAKVIAQLKEELFLIISDDSKKFDINHELDKLKDRNITQIPRDLLEKVKDIRNNAPAA